MYYTGRCMCYVLYWQVYVLCIILAGVCAMYYTDRFMYYVLY